MIPFVDTITKSVANRKRVPWFNHKIKDAIKAGLGRLMFVL